MNESIPASERNLALYAHISGLLAFTGLPFAHVIGPLVFYLQARNQQSAFVLEQSREALNFQITACAVWIVAIVAYVVGMVGFATSAMRNADPSPNPFAFGAFGIGLACVVVALLYAVFDFICVICAAVAVSEGRPFRYPLSIRFVR